MIQSDFDLSANRQDVIVTSRRNLDLLDPIAMAFTEAVLQFCEHPTLQYTWPQFLPSLDEATEFWSGLNERIRRCISETPVLRSRHGTRLRKLDDVVSLTHDFMDEYNHPLIHDGEIDPYISDGYPGTSSTRLRQYGLKYNNFDLVLRLLQSDLDSPESRVKSSKCGKWHSKLAQILLKAKPSRLRDLKLLSLRDGKWVSARTCSTLLPTTNGIPIPEGLPMDMLDPCAISNADRLALYNHLGTSEPSISDVRACIFGLYGLFKKDVGLEASRSHLHFLYTTHQPKYKNEELRRISVHDSNGRSFNPHTIDCFVSSKQPYGPQDLLEATDRSPGFAISFLHSFYHENVPVTSNKTHPSWNRWLYDALGVRERLRLMSRKGDSLSDTWIFVAEHRPEKLLGLLKHLWGYEGPELSKRPDLVAAVRNTSAKNLCNPKLSSSCSLQKTYLPSSTLRQECSRFLEESEEFPFLELEGFSSSPESSAGWMFLSSVFLVGENQSLAFYLDVLGRMKISDHQAFPMPRAQRVLDLYATMGQYASRSFGGDGRVR
jgi:hypothetical protein